MPHTQTRGGLDVPTHTTPSRALTEIEDQLAGESTQSSGHAALSSGTIIRRERAATSSAPAPHPNDKRTVSRVWSPGSPRGRGGGHCQLSQQFGRMILHNNSIVQTRCECSIAMICSQTRVGCNPRLLRWARGSTRLGADSPGRGGRVTIEPTTWTHGTPPAAVANE